MTPVDRAHLELARTAAHVYALDPALVCAIVEQESNWNTWAIRYEPAFYRTYVAPLILAGKIDTITEAECRAFSWGLMQVMGQTAREAGFAGRYLAKLCDPAIGLDIGCRVFRSKLDHAGGDVQNALLHWNGGNAIDYPSMVLARVPNYREETYT